MSMTNEQIVKALECCGNMNECKKECPLDDLGGIDKCIYTLILNAADLIKRKDEELRRMRNAAEYYKEKTKALKKELQEANSEIARLKFPYKMQVEVSKEIENEIKSEAVREFAKRLTEHSSFCVMKSDGKELYETKTYTIRAKIIDELVMEMTEKEGGKG